MAMTRIQLQVKELRTIGWVGKGRKLAPARGYETE